MNVVRILVSSYNFQIVSITLFQLFSLSSKAKIRGLSCGVMKIPYVILQHIAM